MIIKWLPIANQDFEDIVEYISNDNPIAAIEQGDEIEKQLSTIPAYVLSQNGTPRACKKDQKSW